MKKSEKQINFDNTWIDSSKPTISISKVLEMIQEPFDSKTVAEKTYNKRFNDPESDYYQMTVEQILEAWENNGKASRHYGSLLDDYIGIMLTEGASELEMYKLDNDYDDDERLKNITGSFDSFIKFIEENTDLEFVDREKTLFYECDGYYVKGRFDALFYSPSKNMYFIIDWKSTDKIEVKPTIWTSKLLGAAKHYDALNSVTYTMQTHFYKMSLLNKYLPEGTDPNSVQIRIVNLPGHIFEDTGLNYNIYKEQIPYDDVQLKKIFDFAYKKNQLLMNKSTN